MKASHIFMTWGMILMAPHVDTTIASIFFGIAYFLSFICLLREELEE